MKKIKIFTLITITMIILAACSNTDKAYNRYSAEFLDVFDTASQIVGYSDSEEEYRKQIEEIKELLLYYDKLFDIYNTYEGMNNLKTINDQAGIAPVKVEPEIIELLEISKEYYAKTNGHVNIAFGAVLSIWHDYREEGIDNPERAKLPPIEELKKAKEHTNIDDMVIDKKNGTVYLKDPKMRLDVGAIAKGYGVELVAQKIFKDKKNPHFLFSIGGNIRAIGLKPDNESWTVGIQNPDMDSDESIILRVEFSGGSLVTSGGYQRYYTVNSKRYNHIINKDTLMPSENFGSVSVITEDSALADAFSTALFNMSYEEGLRLVNSTDNLDALWVFKDGKIKMSSGFEKIVKSFPVEKP